MSVQLVEHPLGVHIGLSNAGYQADWAIGSSGLKILAHDALAWWWSSPFNRIEPSEADAEEAKHFRMGSATHVALLEGMDGDLDAYEAVYGIRPTLEQHPEALSTNGQYRDWLKARGVRGYSTWDAEQLVLEILRVQPSMRSRLLPVIQQDWRVEGLREITAAEDRRIRLLHAMAMRAPAEDIVLRDGTVVDTLRRAFVGGLSEVSVFWEDEAGIRQRARFDKLKHAMTLDLKTFAAWQRGRDFKRQLLIEAQNRGYVLQVAHYEAGREALRIAVDEGRVYGGTAEERALLSSIAESSDWAWVWVFAVTQGYPHMQGIQHDLAGVVQGAAMRKREDALQKFQLYRDMFGMEQMWREPEPLWRPADEEWPLF